MKQYVLGIDYGTLSGRSLLVDVETGEEIADAEYVYSNAVIEDTLPGDSKKLEPDTALQDPKDWLRVLEKTVPAVLKKSKVKPEQIIGIGTDFTCSTVLPTREDGTPLCFEKNFAKEPHAWPKLWKHHAAQPEADYINQIAEERGEHFLEAYGGKYSSEWFFSKLLQVVNDKPELYDEMDKWIEACDWITWQLTGNERRCVCSAGYKAMWVYPYGDGWAYPHHDFFKALHPKLEHVIHEKLSTLLYPLGFNAGGLTKEMAKLTGLKEGTPVSTGHVDAHAAVPSVGVTTPGKMVMIMGTSTCCMLLGDHYQAVEGMCGTVKDGMVAGTFGYEAGQSAVGDIYHWFAENAAVKSELGLKANASVGDILKKCSELAEKLKIGESGLLALDWWNGNRSVLVDTTLSGCIFGLNMSTKTYEIFRALVEATAFGQRKIIDAFESQGVPVQELYACGGLANKNPFLMQVYADVIGRPIYLADTNQTCAHGAAMHGAVAAGHYEDIHAAAAKMARVKKDECYEPNPENHQAYNTLYAEYCRLHDLLGRHEIPTMKVLKSLRTAAHGE